MGFILLGHGGLACDPALAPTMEVVAIPQGTTLQFYADAGQGLGYGWQELDVWEQFQAPWPPLDSRHVTYNFLLEGNDACYAQELRHDPHFGGHELIRPGIGDVPHRIPLCTGTPATCPTGAAQVAAGARHGCDGILGREDLRGDMYWLACTTAHDAEQAVIDAALTGRPDLVCLGQDPDLPLLLDEWELVDIAEINDAVVDGFGQEGGLTYAAGGSALLISAPAGCYHPRKYASYVMCQSDFFCGNVTVGEKNDAWPGGVFTLDDVPYEGQELVRFSIERFAPGAAVFFSI